MANRRSHTWQEIHDRISRNIKDGIWVPGQLIPGEATLAEQFGCARATVNRALRELAQTGVVDRKRKAGTRVAMQTTRRVSARIPVIRSQIQSTGQHYRFDVLNRKVDAPLAAVRNAMQLGKNTRALHIRSIHYADDLPYIFEDRWVNIQTIPQIVEVDLKQTSINEWLVENIPFTWGEFIVNAIDANKTIAKALSLQAGCSILKSRRLTWLESKSVTHVNLFYAPGFQMRFEI